jgi:uncharacterized membrane protein YidH (DUF202 family)
MELIQKTWVRILLSLLAGGMAVEALHLMTAADINDRSNDKTSAFFWPVSIIVFLILSYVAKRRKYK